VTSYKGGGDVHQSKAPTPRRYLVKNGGTLSFFKRDLCDLAALHRSKGRAMLWKKTQGLIGHRRGRACGRTQGSWTGLPFPVRLLSRRKKRSEEIHHDTTRPSSAPQEKNRTSGGKKNRGEPPSDDLWARPRKKRVLETLHPVPVEAIRHPTASARYNLGRYDRGGDMGVGGGGDTDGRVGSAGLRR